MGEISKGIAPVVRGDGTSEGVARVRCRSRIIVSMAGVHPEGGDADVVGSETLPKHAEATNPT